MTDRTALELLDEYAKHEEKAFGNYRRQYIRETPPPKKPPRMTGFPWITLVFAGIVLCASLLLALRTGPVFYEIARLTVGHWLAVVEGVLAVLAIDVAAVALRFIAVTNHRRGQADIKLTRWIHGAFLVALATEVMSQAYSVRGVASALDSYSDKLEIGIAVAAALSAIILAFASGEILAVLMLQAQATRNEAFSDYNAALSEWRLSLKASWNSNKARLGVKPPPQLKAAKAVDKGRVSADKASDKPPQTKLTKPSELQAAAYLRANPADMGLPVRDLAAKTGINRTAVSNARRFVSTEVSTSMSANGNGTQ